MKNLSLVMLIILCMYDGFQIMQWPFRFAHVCADIHNSFSMYDSIKSKKELIIINHKNIFNKKAFSWIIDNYCN